MAESLPTRRALYKKTTDPDNAWIEAVDGEFQGESGTEYQVVCVKPSDVTTEFVERSQTATNITTIDGSVWPTSGAATTETTGFYVIQAGKFTHGAGQAAPGSAVDRYLVTADDAGGTFHVDAPALKFADGETDYWVEFWLSAERTASQIVADGTSSIFWDIVSGSTKTRVIFYFYALSLRFYCIEAIDNASAQTYEIDFKYEEPVNVSIHYHRANVDGFIEISINGATMSRVYGELGDLQISDSAAQSQWSFLLPSISGIRWKLFCPIKSWAGGDVYRRPDYTLAYDGWMQKYIDPLLSKNDFSYRGSGFIVDSSSTATYTDANYTVGGANPYKTRFVISGSGQEFLASSIDLINDLQFNEYGWASICFDQIYIPSGSSATLSIKTKNGALSIYDFVIENGALSCVDELCEWNHAHRYSLLVHLSQSGSATFTLLDDTQWMNAQTIWSGPLPSWSVQRIGRVKYSIICGASGAEIGGILVAKWAMLVGHDSLTHADATGVSPGYAIFNNVAKNIDYVSYRDFAPGIKPLISGSDTYRPGCYVVGRVGATRRAFTLHALPHMTHTRGVCLLSIDGGSINDISQIQSSDPSTIVNQMIADVNSQISAITANDNLVWLTTMISRVQGTTYSTQERQGILDFNDGVRAIAASVDDNRVIFSDVAAAIADHSALFSSGDDTHFNAAGNKTVAELVYSEAIICG